MRAFSLHTVLLFVLSATTMKPEGISMRDRYRSEKDLPSAKQWFADWMRNRKVPYSDRLINSTQLTDMIYRTAAKDEPVIEPPEYGSPINLQSLAQDMFAALYSFVIRRKEADEVRLRERLINKPILDCVLHDNRFEHLKSLCEDKELPAYDAVSSFYRSLITNMPAGSANIPKLHYLHIIEKLEKQAEQTAAILQAIQTGQKPASAKRMLFLYNRLDRKLSQIEKLAKKAEQAAVCYADSLQEAVSEAMNNAVDQAEQTHAILCAWGDESGHMQNTPANTELLNYVKNSEELRRIARLLGKYREVIADKRKNGYTYGRGEKYDIALGNDITGCLPSEIALLSTPETEILFMRRYEQKRLMQYRKREAVVKGRGDTIVLIDESGSTRRVAGWAKALALALLDIAARDKRKFVLVHFASADDIKTDLFEPGQYTPDDVMKAAEQFFGGGTNFESPLKEALRLMESGYENADITIITDGECRLSEDFTENFRKKIAAYKATVTGILLDKDGPCGKTLEPFCDTIYHSKELTEDEISMKILNTKAA